MTPVDKQPGLPAPITGELISGVVIGALGMFVISQAAGWQFMGPSGPGPGFFPMCYGVAMVAVSLVFVAHRLVTRRSGITGEPVTAAGVAVAVATWAGFVIAIPVMTYFGFLVAITLLALFVMTVVFGRPILHSVAASIPFPVVFQLVFPMLLHVQLPIGRITGF